MLLYYQKQHNVLDEGQLEKYGYAGLEMGMGMETGMNAQNGSSLIGLLT